MSKYKYWGRYSNHGNELLYIFILNKGLIKPPNNKIVIGDVIWNRTIGVFPTVITRDVPKKYCKPLKNHEVVALRLLGKIGHLG
jgi:hypothetical protein